MGFGVGYCFCHEVPDIISVILEQELDGSAISMGLASSPGPDWIKEIVPLLGVRLKVHNALRALFKEEMVCT